MYMYSLPTPHSDHQPRALPMLGKLWLSSLVPVSASSSLSHFLRQGLQRLIKLTLNSPLVQLGLDFGIFLL